MKIKDEYQPVQFRSAATKSGRVVEGVSPGKPAYLVQAPLHVLENEVYPVATVIRLLATCYYTPTANWQSNPIRIV